CVNLTTEGKRLTLILSAKPASFPGGRLFVYCCCETFRVARIHRHARHRSELLSRCLQTSQSGVPRILAGRHRRQNVWLSILLEEPYVTAVLGCWSDVRREPRCPRRIHSKGILVLLGPQEPPRHRTGRGEFDRDSE